MRISNCRRGLQQQCSVYGVSVYDCACVRLLTVSTANNIYPFYGNPRADIFGPKKKKNTYNNIRYMGGDKCDTGVEGLFFRTLQQHEPPAQRHARTHAD